MRGGKKETKKCKYFHGQRSISKVIHIRFLIYSSSYNAEEQVEPRMIQWLGSEVSFDINRYLISRVGWEEIERMGT